MLRETEQVLATEDIVPGKTAKAQTLSTGAPKGTTKDVGSIVCCCFLCVDGNQAHNLSAATRVSVAHSGEHLVGEPQETHCRASKRQTTGHVYPGELCKIKHLKRCEITACDLFCN